MKKVLIVILISFILFGCTSSNKFNEEITVKGKIEQQEIIQDGSYKIINVLALEDSLIIEGTAINKIELDTEEEYDNETKEITGTLSKDTVSDLSYSLKNIK